ncbi:MAG: hypothetical protein EAS52_19710 [Parapedobacter sp.]|nr:MAG: hypothetical protein EAS52_19710 [Parapedobacter sp.]
MKEAKYISTLPISLFSAAVASVVGGYIGYQLGLHAYNDVLLDELLVDMYYADNPVDCLPCDKGIKYEWFYVERPLDNHLPEEEFLTEQEEGGKAMDP